MAEEGHAKEAHSEHEHAHDGAEGHEHGAANEHADAGHGDVHGAGAEEVHDYDPIHHITDYPVVGLGTDGHIHFYPQSGHGHAAHGEGAGYTAATVGPFPLEFTRAMQDLTVVAVLFGAVILLVVGRIRARISADKAPQGPLANLVETLVIFVRDELVVPMGGKHVAPYTPLFLTYFFFILVNNFTGMIPYLFHGATGNSGVTAALGGSVFVFLTILGMSNQGPIKYFLNMVPHGTPAALWPLMFVLELIGPIIKCFVLCVRLFANMIAGHLVVGNVLALGIFKGANTGMAVMGVCVGLPLALGVGFLEILVCLIQAYVFTMLAIIFVSSAVHPEH